MKIANYTELRNNLRAFFDAVIDDTDTVVVNRSGGKGVVLMSLDEYNSLKETEYILSSQKTMEDIRQGEEDLRNGRGVEVDISKLL